MIIKIIDGHECHLPSVPEDKREILFHDAKRDDDAYWRRDLLIKDYREIWFDFVPDFTMVDKEATLYNQDGELISLNKEDSEYIRRIYSQEMNRRIHGIYFRNAAIPTYLTGSHYFALMWAKSPRTDGGEYLDYREFQGDFFYLIRHCWMTANVLGLDLSKPKKTGITNLMWLYYLNKATSIKRKNLGHMNIDMALGAKTFSDYFLYAHNGLPHAFRPKVKSISERDGRMIFGAAFSKNKRTARQTDSDMELNTSVFCVPTKPKAFDVAVMDDAWCDEFPKYEKESPSEIFRTNKQAVKIQSRINGRMWLTSYTPEEDSTAFREARKIFWDSELSTCTYPGGETTSQMINHHIPAYGAWEGCFDKHGICDEKRAFKENEQERLKVKSDRRGYQAIVRQYANTKKEAWGSAGTGSIYDNMRIAELMADLQVEQRSTPGTGYREGRLEWVNPLWEDGLFDKRRRGEFTGVRWVDLTDAEKESGKIGKMRIYEDIAPYLQNEPIRLGKDENGCLRAPARHPFVLGGDPTNYAAGSEVIEGSKNSAHLMSMPDDRADASARRTVSKIIHIEYYDRPELPQEAYEDYLKLIIWTGALAVIEANAAYVATRLMEEGMGNYMVVRDENGFLVKWERWMGMAHEAEKKYSLLRTTANNALSREILETIVRYIKNYIERRPSGQKDYGKTIKSERLLDQFANFDAEDTRLFDLHMSFGYTLIGLYFYIDYLLRKVDADDIDRHIGRVLVALAH